MKYFLILILFLPAQDNNLILFEVERIKRFETMPYSNGHERFKIEKKNNKHYFLIINNCSTYKEFKLDEGTVLKISYLAKSLKQEVKEYKHKNCLARDSLSHVLTQKVYSSINGKQMKFIMHDIRPMIWRDSVKIKKCEVYQKFNKINALVSKVIKGSS